MKVVISDDYQNCIRHLDCFSKMAGHDVTIYNDTLDDIDALAGRFQEAEAIALIRERTHITEELLGRLPNLKIVSQTGAGFGGHVDLEACTRHKVAVAAGGTGTHSTCELTWGLIHCAMRSIPQEIRNLAEGGWQTTLGEDLYGKTLGVYSYGNIGGQVAAVGKAFGMNVITYGRESFRRARTGGRRSGGQQQRSALRGGRHREPPHSSDSPDKGHRDGEGFEPHETERTFGEHQPSRPDRRRRARSGAQGGQARLRRRGRL